MPNLGGWEIIVLVGVLVLVFGASKLPTIARSVGQSARVLKGEMKGLKQDFAMADTAATPDPATPDPATPDHAATPTAAEPTPTMQLPVVDAISR